MADSRAGMLSKTVSHPQGTPSLLWERAPWMKGQRHCEGRVTGSLLGRRKSCKDGDSKADSWKTWSLAGGQERGGSWEHHGQAESAWGAKQCSVSLLGDSHRADQRTSRSLWDRPLPASLLHLLSCKETFICLLHPRQCCGLVATYPHLWEGCHRPQVSSLSGTTSDSRNNLWLMQKEW